MNSPVTRVWAGTHLEITYDLARRGAVLRSLSVTPSSVYAQGTSHLLEDWRGFLRQIPTDGPVELRDPDPDLRVLLETFGFRGGVGPGRVMRLRPGTEPPPPVFGSVRPGGFEAGCLIRLASGEEVPARDLDVGDRVADGGVVTEIIEGLISRVARSEAGLVSALNAVWNGSGWVRVPDHPAFEPEERPSGVRCLFLTTERHLVRAGGRLFTDMWETGAARAARFGMQPEVLRILNGGAPDA